MAALGHKNAELPAGSNGRTLAIGAGGAGTLAVTHLKALHLSRFGRVRPGARFLGFDVMETPPIVSVPGSSISANLEPGIEYCQIGEGCDPTRLSQMARVADGVNPELRRLIDRQPDGRFTKSLQTGTEGERLYGLLAFTWSVAQVRRAIVRSLRAINDLRLPGSNGATSAPGVSLQVMILASLAGGVGSSIALPLCGEVKKAMDDLGMDVHRSTFIGVYFTPDCFPETELRLANAFETLNDLNLAQKEAMIP